jgi:hypothetical protein
MLFKLKYVFSIFFCTILVSVADAQKINDTIFFNANWHICEKPLAEYYRIGTIKIDSIWNYTGPFKDYSMAGILQSEGNYSEDGLRDGRYSFYDSDGKLVAAGNYKQGKLTGNWEWKYTDGSPRAIINFPEKEEDFKFVFYRDTYGKTQLQNGTGSFVWSTAAFGDSYSNYTVYGAFAAGKRTGEWKYYNVTGEKGKSLLCEEKYDDTGELKKARRHGYNAETIHKNCYGYQFTPLTIRITEKFTYDEIFARGPDSLAETNLLNYLLNRKSVDIVIGNKKYEDAIRYILGNLESYRDQVDYTSKDLQGKIEFKIGDSSRPENITVSGENISKEEKQFLLYLMSKFKNIEMPTEGSVGLEGYHAIYFYTVDMKALLPVGVRDFSGKELLFSMIPKDKYLIWLNANKKKIKKYIRKEILHYW